MYALDSTYHRPFAAGKAQALPWRRYAISAVAFGVTAAYAGLLALFYIQAGSSLPLSSKLLMGLGWLSTAATAAWFRRRECRRYDAGSKRQRRAGR